MIKRELDYGYTGMWERFDMEFRFWGAEIEMNEKAGEKRVGRGMLHTPLEQVAEHGYKVGSREALLRIDQTAKVHIWSDYVLSNW
jgi:hypothetical protein